MKLSTGNFTLQEFSFSPLAEKHGLDNRPPDALLPAVLRTLEGLESVRSLVGDLPITISSGYRCEDLNTIVRGSKTSQHMKGEAADISCKAFGSPRELAILIRDNEDLIKYDQLILEATWVHISFSLKPRYQALTVTRDGISGGIT